MKGFSAKEFVQGLVIGVLLGFVVCLLIFG